MFVGRQNELAQLHAGLDTAVGGRGRLFLISGEPGIGKTRLASEVALAATEREARVVWGICHEGEGAPPYWPWTQVLRAAFSARDLEQAIGELGLGGEELSRMIFGAGAEAEVPAGESEQARFRLFHALTKLLQNAAKAQPLVVVLDDVHWADEPSLLLLRFLGPEIEEARILVLATYRSADAGARSPILEVLGTPALGTRIALGGLQEKDVARFIELSAGMPIPPTLVAAVYKETEGNPFFVGEVMRLLAAEGRLERPEDLHSWRVTIPQGVRDVLSRRLRRLSARCNEVLTIAAVVGREFDLVCLEGVAGWPRREILGALDEATSAGVVEIVSGALGRYRFQHALIRETLYDSSSVLDRVERHRKMGQWLEEFSARDPEPYLAALAHHFLQAAAAGEAEKAIAYSTRAGNRALQRIAYEEAANHFERALQALNLSSPNEERRCRLLADLGEARMRAGANDGAREALRDAISLARALGSAELLARAALAFGWWVEPGKTDNYLVEQLETAASLLPPEDSALRARVLAHLAAELWYAGRPERRAAISQEAVEMARRVGDARALGEALSARHLALWGPENVDERLAAATEVVQLASANGDTERALQGRVWQVVDHLELGNIHAVDVGIAACARFADELKQPGYLWWTAVFRGMRALLDGRFAAAESLIQEAFALGQRSHNQNAVQVFATQMFLLRREQGRLEELEGAFHGMVEQYPDIPSWRCGLAMLYGQVGRALDARREFERLADRDFVDLPRDLFWLIAVALLSEICASLDDRRRAAILYDLLLPYAARTVVTGRAVVCAGSAAHYLGILAAVLSRPVEAARHFEAAIEMNTRLGAHPFIANTQCEYARLLVARGERGDRRRALDLLEQALRTAEELKMGFLARKARALSAEARETSRAVAAGDGGVRGVAERGSNVVSFPGRVSDREEPRAPAVGTSQSLSPGDKRSVFRREGVMWTIAYEGTVFRVKDSNGFRFISQLLVHPNQEVHVFDLVAAREDVESELTAQLGRMSDEELAKENLTRARPGDAGEVLDARARAAYKARLEELRERLAQFGRSGDPAQAEDIESEIEFLTRELAAAAGFGGATRRAGSAAERARLNVTRSIKAALKTISGLHPSLGLYLSTTIRTGTFCVFSPDPRIPVTWTL